LTTEPIRLDQFLKLVGLVQSGGEAKHLIQGGQVQLNGIVETRRSKKLAAGDVVTFQGQSFTLSDESVGKGRHEG
jgi:ribosome-associated protein